MLVLFVSDSVCILLSHRHTAARLCSTISQLNDRHWFLIQFHSGCNAHHVDSGNDRSFHNGFDDLCGANFMAANFLLVNTLMPNVLLFYTALQLIVRDIFT